MRRQRGVRITTTTPAVIMRSYRLLSVALLLVTTACAHGAAAQSSTAAATPMTPGVEATRQELQSTLARARATDANGPVALEVQRRLQQGDFQPGDRIYLEVTGDTALTDTFTVRPGPALLLPQMPAFSLRGVLRSELDSVVTAQISKYLREPEVQAVALIRIAVLGPVGKPGFYDLPAEARATDVVMLAGGPQANANLRKSYVRRGGQKVLEKEQVQAALDQGQSLDQMNLASGDEFVVGESGGGILKVLPYIGAVTGIAYGLTRIF
ncbi:MAG TPA: SLBB domain-containing protein [Gemmatimonadales bacterium]|nr:SLBB domain-containing protein [Gemmatimonadales bacterium]